MRQKYLLLSLSALLMNACAVEFKGDGTSPTEGGSFAPTNDETSIQYSGSIDAIYPADGSDYLPPALELTAQLSAPWQGADGEITGRFGATCDSGVILQPEYSSDRTEIHWNVSADADSNYCFRVLIGNEESPIEEFTSEFRTAPCGVTFNVGYGAQFKSVGGDDTTTTVLNEALKGYSYPLMMSFSNLTKGQSFPIQPQSVAMGRILQVFSESPEGYNPTGLWATDPYLGASSVLSECDIAEDGALSCASDEVQLPISLQMGTLTTEGSIIQYGEYQEINVKAVQIAANAVASGNFNGLENLLLTGAVAQSELKALAEASGSNEFSNWIDGLDLDVDVDGDGENDSLSIELTSSPVWIPMLECETSLY